MSLKRMRVLLLGMVLIAPVLRAETREPLKAGCRVAIIGDSITEQRLYSNYIETYLLACCPELKAVVFQFGWSGETAAGFEKRMANDMAWYKPTHATICFGMNDGRYSRLTPELEMTFQAALQRILATLKKNGTFAVVGGPGAVDTKSYRPRGDSSVDARVYNETLRRLSDVSSSLATESGFQFAYLHQTMKESMARAKQARGIDYLVCGADGVHPSPNGHLIMAYAFLKALGVTGDIGTIRMSMRDGRATATNGHRILSSAAGRVELESARYPYCFTDLLRYPQSPTNRASDPFGVATILPFIPFNQELNRLVLQVDGLAWEKAKVSWGNQSKIFSKKELEAGVNLAAEFIDDSPFAEAFNRVQRAVAIKQEFETLLVKSWLTRVPALEKLPGEDVLARKSVSATTTRLMDTWESLREAAPSRVAPVKHAILIEEAR
jgi:lysophospholipase L1-like esterase